jgi:hypothetical protein
MNNTKNLHWNNYIYMKAKANGKAFVTFRNKHIFYGELLAPRPNPKQEDRHLSAVRDYLFNIYAATLHIWRPSPPSATWGRAMTWWKGPTWHW